MQLVRIDGTIVEVSERSLFKSQIEIVRLRTSVPDSCVFKNWLLATAYGKSIFHLIGRTTLDCSLCL